MLSLHLHFNLIRFTSGNKSNHFLTFGNIHKLTFYRFYLFLFLKILIIIIIYINLHLYYIAIYGAILNIIEFILLFYLPFSYMYKSNLILNLLYNFSVIPAWRDVWIHWNTSQQLINEKFQILRNLFVSRKYI